MVTLAFDICRHLYATGHGVGRLNLPYWYSQRGESSRLTALRSVVRHFSFVCLSVINLSR